MIIIKTAKRGKSRQKNIKKKHFAFANIARKLVGKIDSKSAKTSITDDAATMDKTTAPLRTSLL
jgi:hypothetical protein